MKNETLCLHAGYTPKNGEPRVLPIVQSTTFCYDSTEHIGELFDLTADGFFYSRLGNPTVAAVEAKIAALEGGVGALCTSSGQAASLFAILNICSSGDHIVSTASIYGGTINLFAVTLKRMGIECTFVDQRASVEEISAAIQENTKAIFGETIANPALDVLDIEKMAEIAHAHDLPLIIDNTFATPILCRPFEFGADIVIHSTTKYMDGHAVQVGGVIVDSGKFNWANGKFPDFTEVDESYHGITYVGHFKEAAFIAKARVQLMRDLGSTPSPNSAFLLNLGLETLPLRIAKHSENALAAAKFLEAHPKVVKVNYPGLASSPFYTEAQKYLPNGASGVVSFDILGDKETAVKFMDSLELASNVVHVADIRTCVLHPASETHRQLTSEQLVQAGISETMIRLSVGLEHIDDIIADLEKAFAAI